MSDQPSKLPTPDDFLLCLDPADPCACLAAIQYAFACADIGKACEILRKVEAAVARLSYADWQRSCRYPGLARKQLVDKIHEVRLRCPKPLPFDSGEHDEAHQAWEPPPEPPKGE